ncbi:protein abnormal spindle [Episyrphus balteatus]|uniref:protein abnormal spindle n=1 Tax=Episyrphus balteatus TaxID=286459 RepID=UPI0024868452|nr:protein abnormal spindle [Episyrphus balteatus]
MSAFEVNITPSRLKANKRNEGREPTSVVMAPFSSKAIVTFEDVPVSKTAKRILKIFNPSSDEIEVHVTKFIRAEHNVTIDWTSNVVPAEEQIEMEMIWSPSIEIACKETLQLTDNRNFRKDIMVILKSISNKPISKNIKRFPTISSSTSGHTKVLRLKSPTHSKPNTQSQQRRNRQSLNYKAQKTDRMSPVAKKHQQQHSQKKQISPLVERNIPQIVFEDMKTVPPSQTQVRSSSNNHKENVSPLTPGNVLDLIDKMQFTPATETKLKLGQGNELEYLSSLPTPINRNASNVDENFQSRQLRPRRLVADPSDDEISPMNLKIEPRTTIVKQEYTENCENDAGAMNMQTPLINNKTFDLKLLNKSDGLSDSQESFEAPCDRIVFNKTTTVNTPALSRPLSMIEEEETNNVPNILQKTYEIKVVDEQLKRDVKLVGTPLRKYSESMKDLSLKSPFSKISIQGSMPNLNEMENIQSIEQNRYYHAPKAPPTIEKKCFLKPKAICLDDSDASNNSFTSCASHADILFNQNEILAQSSRFNLNEIGKKSRKNSPVSVPIPNNRRTPPTKAAKKLIESPNKSVGTKRYRDLALLDSPGSDTSILSIPKVVTASVSPPKRAKFECDSFARTSTGASSKWPIMQPRKPKLSRTLSLVKKPITPRKIKEEPIVKLYDSEMYMQTYINPDPFAATTTRDPFLASTMYLDERAVEKHLVAFKKWLNALVTIPADLDTDCNQKIDVGRLFNEVRNKELILAPTKEEQSMNYLTKFRLESLRQEAIKFFMSEEMQIPCSKVAVYVHKKAISIRTDRNLHLDVVMQRYILELLLCFNPLWLRLGLEVVFAEKIHLHSCSDVVGLSTFIVNRLFKDKFLEQRYSKAYTLSDEYADHIKKFTLQKVLFLLLFLDKAKTKRIIKHNPCLFLKKSPYKEAREILLKFSCELLANIGDITRDLKRLGYVLTHKQNFLDEFNYAFSNLAVDLRDGIRLTRVMEIILLRDDMSELLRVPAISRLQRIYNVNLSLKALADAEFQLKGEITAADIVDGHREKTLSLLWQIIYKFRSPKFHAAARVIQLWWRNSWLAVCIRRRIRVKIEKRRNLAATVIQSAYRGYMSRKYTEVFRWERTNAAICLQKYIRRHLAQKQFCRTVNSVLCIQRMYRAVKYGMLIRQRFVDFRNRVLLIQCWFRRIKFARKLEQAAPIIKSIQAEALLRHNKSIIIQRNMKAFTLRQKFRRIVYEVVSQVRSSKLEYKSAAKIQSSYKMLKLRREFLKKREAVCKIQQIWRSYQQMKVIREEYVLQRQSAICIQSHYRSFKLMQKERCEYLRVRSVVVKLQNRVRANKLCRIQRTEYLKIRQSVIVIQQRFKATLVMRRVRLEYQRQRLMIVKCQQRYRAILCMRKQRAEYLDVRTKVVSIQRFYRGWIQMKKDRAELKKVLSVIAIQRRFRATMLMRKVRKVYQEERFAIVKCQQRFRANVSMRKQRAEYIDLRSKVICIQRFYRGWLQMKKDRAELKKILTVIAIQRRFRATMLMRKVRKVYQEERLAIVKCQQRFRAKLSMRKQRAEYIELRIKVICIQKFYRGWLQMKKDRAEFKKIMKIILIQRRFRATLLMWKTRKEYQRQRSVIIKCQQRFRATLSMQKQRAEYLKIRSQVICIQTFYRARLHMKKDRAEYVKTRNAIVKIQQKLRATILARKVCAEYIRLTYYTTVIQRQYRGLRQMRIERSQYLKQISHIVQIQRRIRATQQMKVARQQFLLLKKSAIVIQLKFRAYLAMRLDRAKFRGKKLAAICIQQRFREYLSMKKHRNEFILQKQAVITIQQRFRALLTMRCVKFQYENLRKNVVNIQRRWRAQQEMKLVKANYENTRKLIITIQQRFRAKLLGRTVKMDYERERSAIIAIQRRFRSKILMKQIRKIYTERVEMIVHIQQRFKSYLLMKKQRTFYVKQKQSAISIQRWYRSVLHMRKEKNTYLHTKTCVVTIQRYWRSTLYARKQQSEYLNLRNSALVIQRKFRATLAMRRERNSYQQQRKNAIVLQRRYRARLAMLKMRSQYLLIKSLIVCIQRKFRANRAMKSDRQAFLQLKKATIFIQQKFRGRQQTILLKNRYTQIKRVTLGLQAFGRGFLARKRYEELMTPEFRLLVLQRKSAVVIQRYWRGYRVRRRWENVRIRTIRANIKVLKESRNVLNTIRWKVQDSVRILRGRFSASDALNVLSRLERMSRTVPHLLMEHSDFISTFCYGIMAQAIRSEVDKQLIEYCSRVILNLARYNSTTANTFQEGGLVTIAQMLLRWCDKDCGIFNTLCTLIWVFAHSPEKRQKIREFMTTAEAIYVVRETKKLVARKEKMKKNIRKPLMSAAVRDHHGIVFGDKALPSLEPDYGVIRNKPYVFISSVFGFDSVLSKLKIDIYSF